MIIQSSLKCEFSNAVAEIEYDAVYEQSCNIGTPGSRNVGSYCELSSNDYQFERKNEVKIYHIL